MPGTTLITTYVFEGPPADPAENVRAVLEREKEEAGTFGAGAGATGGAAGPVAACRSRAHERVKT